MFGPAADHPPINPGFGSHRDTGERVLNFYSLIYRAYFWISAGGKGVHVPKRRLKWVKMSRFYCFLAVICRSAIVFIMIITESRRTAKFYHIFLLIAGGGKRSPAALGKINGSCCRDHERLLPRS